MQINSKIYVAGHKGLVGRALIKELSAKGYTDIVTKTHSELDLTDQKAVIDFFDEAKPEHVFLAAAKVGGIYANNTYPAEFIHDNLIIQDNVIHQAWKNNVKRLLFLGSSCIYPRNCPQPIKEEYLLTGPLEPTNRPYAIAKIAGIESCWSYNRQYGTQYLAVMPTNLFGPGDNYDIKNSHVLPALIRKMHEAKQNGDKKVIVWGTGKPRREFLYSDDMANACVHLMSLSDTDFKALLNTNIRAPLINIGCGKDQSIRELINLVKEVVGFNGEIEWDTNKPDGTPQKLLDIERLNSLGWKPKVELNEGIEKAYLDYWQSGK